MTERILTDANGRKYITREPLLHLSQREWQGLTDDELRNIAREFKGNTQRRFEDHWDEIMAFIREAEAKLREKNT